MSELILAIEKYIRNFLIKNLSAELGFHSLSHTCDVVEAALEIGKFSGLTNAEMEILVIAAWFHDSGYAYTYSDHEQESKRIAWNFLDGLHVDSDIVLSVLDCIDATKFPQRPNNLIEKVLCDADLCHLSKRNYPQFASELRMEFEYFLNKNYSDEEWTYENCSMLSNHVYWTEYGKTILERDKQINIGLMKCSPLQ